MPLMDANWVRAIRSNKSLRWLARHFGNAEQQRMAIYLELSDLGVGDLGAEGWNLSETPDEAIEEALEWMDGKIRLARV